MELTVEKVEYQCERRVLSRQDGMELNLLAQNIQVRLGQNRTIWNESNDRYSVSASEERVEEALTRRPRRPFIQSVHLCHTITSGLGAQGEREKNSSDLCRSALYTQAMQQCAPSQG